jgi:dihydroxyacetone kinase-like predicted kinase
MALFADALEAHRDEIDSLNVFPVPDGDTGTNLLLTQRPVVDALPSSGSLPDMMAAMAEAALRSARGNSGVILSQVYDGLARGLQSSPAGSEAVATALREGSRAADRTMGEPQEGTILTVLRAAADAAEVHAPHASAATALRAALEAARSALEATRDGLPDLRRAGVVDAGGKGVVLLLDALLAALTDGALTEPVGPLGPVGVGGSGVELVGRPGVLSTERYEIQLRIEAPEADPVRAALSVEGDSVAIGGGPGRWLVHVHTHDPIAAAGAAAELGATEVLTVESLQAGGEPVASTGLVVLAEGDGLASVLRSLGAVVVPFDSGRGVPAAQIAAATGASGRDDVVVVAPRGAPDIPSNVARRGRNEGARTATVTTLGVDGPIGSLAAAAAFDPAAEGAVNLARMRAAADGVREVALTGADVDGQQLGELVSKMAPELVTVLAGASASPADRQRVEHTLRERFPTAEVKVLDGGQRSSAFLVGVE